MAIKQVNDKTFKEITQHELEDTSYLNLFNILKDDDDQYFLNIFRSFVINEELVMDILYYQTYEIDDQDWYDTISYKYYNDVSLWWLPLVTNTVLNPFEEIEPGKLIKILKSNLIPLVVKEIRDIVNK